jgi:hypothetical protein
MGQIFTLNRNNGHNDQLFHHSMAGKSVKTAPMIKTRFLYSSSPVPV